MTENRRQILDMLAEGKISVDEAERLLALVEQPPGGESRRASAPEGDTPAPKYLRIVVEPNPDGSSDAGKERVNIRVPMGLIRAGVKLTALIPSDVGARVNDALRKQGIDLDLRALKAQDLDQIIDGLRDLEVEAEDGQHKVHVYTE